MSVSLEYPFPKTAWYEKWVTRWQKFAMRAVLFIFYSSNFTYICRKVYNRADWDVELSGTSTSDSLSNAYPALFQGAIRMITLNGFIQGGWDYILFAILMAAVFIGMLRFMYKYWVSMREILHMRTVLILMAFVTVAVLCGGWFLVERAEKRVYEQTKEILVGDAPILAYELTKQGHEKIGLNTSEKDPQYLQMIETMVEWMKLNRQIESIYTIRKLKDGRNAFILGPETDYNHNGYIDGDKEARVPIGTIYDEQIPELEEAFQGRLTFQSEVSEDQWGVTISAFVPIFDSAGRQEAVLGLDFDGESYVKNVALSRLDTIAIVFFVLLIFDVALLIRIYYFDERQYRRHQNELIYQATHDSLTGLPNGRLFRERLARTLAELPGQDHTAAVLVLDIDRFKSVNDSLGHRIGDELLQRFAERLCSVLDDSDFMARPGGDEFFILMSHVRSPEEVLRKVKRALDLFDQPIMVGNYELYATTSVGASLYSTGGTDADTLIRNADTAMYFAKERGNRLHMYTEDMNGMLLERLSLENDLRKGIERGELSLVYQPKVDTRSGKAVGMEALVRWNHPDRGMVSPGKFIPLAEDTGLIVPLGEWVLAEACRQLKIWEAKGLRPLPVSVNLSSVQFKKKDLIIRIRDMISQHQINPALLELELTESCLMQSPELSSHTLHLLKKAGLSIALDDFGTGYSSLSYLRSFPLDVLKIDKSFVKDVTSNPDNAAITSTIITLAHSLGLKVICEGVETKEQLDFLRGRQCDEIQGFYFSPPIPPEEFEKWLDRARDEDGILMAELS
jgi:diguanylate cyclase (GGDEF)-like protein